MTETRTDNDFLIGTNSAGIVSGLPLVIGTRQQAYRTAAYLKLMSAVLPDEDPASSFEDVETAIANT